MTTRGRLVYREDVFSFLEGEFSSAYPVGREKDRISEEVYLGKELFFVLWGAEKLATRRLVTETVAVTAKVASEICAVSAGGYLYVGFDHFVTMPSFEFKASRRQTENDTFSVFFSNFAYFTA